MILFIFVLDESEWNDEIITKVYDSLIKVHFNSPTNNNHLGKKI